LVFSIVALVFVNRSNTASLIKAFTRPNAVLVVVLAGVTIMLSLTLLWPYLRELFRFGALHGDDLAVTIGAGIGLLLILDAIKFAKGKFRT
jgi:P-type Ca2+ transporter type 2C